jgi:putative holliday junction resolvase
MRRSTPEFLVKGWGKAVSGLFLLADFAPMLGPRSRLLGLDLGTKTIGLAVASWPDGIATAVTTLQRTRFQDDAVQLMSFIRREKITHVVLGMPLHLGGEEGRRAQATRAFARNLQILSPPPILFFDERLTTAEADDRMREAGVSHAKRADIIDAVAAAVILENAMSALRLELDAPR